MENSRGDFFYGDTDTLTITGGSGTGAVTWAVADGTGSATINASTGEVTVTHAGTFTVTATKAEDANYQSATATCTLTAEPRPVTVMAITGTTTKPYDGTTDCTGTGLTLTLSGVVEGDNVTATAVYTYDNANAGENKAVTAAGFKLAGDAAGNYCISSGQSAISAPVGTITKATYSGTQTVAVSSKHGATGTYNLANLLPEGYKLGEPTKKDDNNIFDGEITLTDTTVTYKLANNAVVDKTGTITVPVTESTNYNPFDLTITVTVKDVDIPVLTTEPITATYTGKPIEAAITGTAKVGETEVQGTWEFDANQTLTNVSDSGTKNVTFTPEDTAQYGTAHGTVVVTIQPAAITGAEIKLSQSAFRYDGEEHQPQVKTVTLNSKELSTDDYTAEIPSAKDAGTYKVTITGKGSQTSDWALDAMRWAVENGIVNGHGNGWLDPKGQATRAQVAQMLMRYVNLMQE